MIQFFKQMTLYFGLKNMELYKRKHSSMILIPKDTVDIYAYFLFLPMN